TTRRSVRRSQDCSRMAADSCRGLRAGVVSSGACMDPIAGLFDHVLDLPNAQARRRLESLIGLDAIRMQLLKQAAVLMNPGRLDDWSEQFHGSVLPAVQR